MDSTVSANSTNNGSLFQGYSYDALREMVAFLYYGPNPNESLGYPLGELENFTYSQCIVSIHSGARISCATVLLLLLFLIAHNYKSPIFILYQVNFALMIIGSALELAWVFSFSGSIIGYMTGAQISMYSSNVSMAASVFQTLLMLTLLATLVLQVYIAFSDQKRQVQIAAMLGAALACFPAYFVCIWRLAVVGVALFGSSKSSNGFGTGSIMQVTGGGSLKYKWAFLGAWRSFAASCAFCSLILCVKFYYVNRNRAKMGLVRFDPLKILFTMALQNSVIPSILAIISAGINVDNAGGQSVSASAIPVCACMLPIGYIWAQYKMYAKVAEGSNVGNNMHMRVNVGSKGSQIRDDYSELSTARFGEQFDDMHTEKSSLAKR